MLRVAICEDDPVHLQLLQKLMERYQSLRPDHKIVTGRFVSAKELLYSIESRHIYDIYLLDIMMPGINGIELARELRTRGDEAPLVFLTSSADYALDAFDVNAAQYVLKPIKEDKLFVILDKLVAELKKRERESFFVTTPERMAKVAFSSIIFVETALRTLKIHLDCGHTITSKTIRVPFEVAAAPLLGDARFLHIHKSFILNMAHVSALTTGAFIMSNGSEVPIPRHRRAEAKAKYHDYLQSAGLAR